MRLLALVALSGAAAQQDCAALPSSAFTPITLSNSRGLSLTFLPFGGTAQNLMVPRARGAAPIDILLGFDDATAYCTGGPTAQHPYFGALIGRVANRIARCAFSLGGTRYALPCNEHQAATGLNDTLHGGPTGYDRAVWTVAAKNASSATLELLSPAGDMGFPSSLRLRVTYSVAEPGAGAPPSALGAWDIAYEALNTGDLPSPVAPTNHAYFMLSGFTGGEETVLAHTLRMANATRYQQVDAGLIPTGALLPVAAQPWMSFVQAKAVGADFPLPSGAAGYDNAWVLEGGAVGRAFAPAAELEAPASGLRMVTWTDAPSLQVYTGNFLSATGPTAVAKKASQRAPGASETYVQHSAITFEAQR